jgi:hypothetical protein
MWGGGGVVKVKVKFTLLGHEGPEGNRGITLLFP